MSIRIGIVDFDSSHCIEFTRRINHVEIEADQWVDGARVVLGCPGTSLLSPERLSGFTAQMEHAGIPLVSDPEEMIGKIDAVMIESVDGSVHLDRARPFLEAGVTCFIDKPLTCSVADAESIAGLARRHQVACFSSSALRYAPELVAFRERCHAGDSTAGRILGAFSYGPAPTRVRNPGLFHYGIHATEVLFALLGPGCAAVHRIGVGGEPESEEAGVDIATAQWQDGRFATVRGIRSGHRAFGCIAFCENGIHHIPIDTRWVYRELLKQVIAFFHSKQPPVHLAETLEIIEFIEKARSGGGNLQNRSSVPAQP